MKRVIVIGAGASGLMAAYAAAKNGNIVTVLEKNEKAGKKIYITGKGRCNLTNDVPPAEFLENVVHNPKFLTGSVYSFPPEKLIRFFEDGGMHVKIERGNRAFPVSDKASDVTKCLEKYCLREGVDFLFNTNVDQVQSVEEHSFWVICGERKFQADAVIICTGGVSYPGTGSSGDGYKFANRFGISVKATRAALCGINCDMKVISELQGLSLKNVQVTASRNEKRIASFFGEMLFTHFGISGPAVLSLSSYINDYDPNDLMVTLDLKPALGADVLDKRLLRDFDKFKNKQIRHALFELLPKSLIIPVLSVSGISPSIPVNAITKKQREQLIFALKNFKLKPLSLRPVSEAIVTAGGVDVKEINPKTMESKRIHGLYFCGEVLDVDALTGGFNLHIAFSTGFLAGNSIK